MVSTMLVLLVLTYTPCVTRGPRSRQKESVGVEKAPSMSNDIGSNIISSVLLSASSSWSMSLHRHQRGHEASTTVPAATAAELRFQA